jgi:hypothetical protein
MDVIILAAGENVRLQAAGLAPGRKPLLMHEGEVLIRRLCRQVRSDAWIDRLIIVVSPRNVEDIVFATKGFDAMYIVQSEATGPQDAFSLGLKLTRSSSVMLLMGDNFIPEWRHISSQWPSVHVVQSADEALHPLTDGGFFIAQRTGECPRWLGPLVVCRAMLTTDKSWRDWLDVFDDVAFDMMDSGGVMDMGVLP